MNEIDILLPLGNGSHYQNVETRVALRSIVANATGWRRILIVGSDPGFIRESERCRVVHHKEIAGNKEARIALKVVWSFNNLDLSEHVAFWNDDFVLTKPTDVRTIPFYHRGPLKETIKIRRPGTYRNALMLTMTSLAKAGFRTNHYDIHAPIVYQRDRFLGLADWWERSRQSECGLVVKSVYANTQLSEPGPKMEDCKIVSTISHSQFQKLLADRWIISYSDDALRFGLTNKLLTLFPDKSPFEI